MISSQQNGRFSFSLRAKNRNQMNMYGRKRKCSNASRTDDLRTMKKDKAKAMQPGANKHVGEDPAKFISEIAVNKKGGDFNLPFGGEISVPPGAFSRKDVVTCCAVSPSDRFKYQPPIKSDEHMLSEIFLLAMNTKALKKGQSISVRLPFYPENLELYSVQLLSKSADQTEWMVKECEINEERRLVQFDTDIGGIFVVTSCTKQEVFEVPVQGCLYNAKIHHQIFVRFPKKTVDVPIECHISIIPINKSVIGKLSLEYPRDMDNLITASDFYEIKAHTEKTFRRSVTVKLPLPVMDEDFPHDDVAIMMLTNDGWQMYDAPMKFIKNIISFDIRYLTRFCIALAKPQRKKRLKEAFRHIERENLMTRGEIVPFIHIQEHLWTLWFDVVPWSKIGPTIDKRLEQGFRRITKMYLPQIEDPEENRPIMSRRSWRSKLAKQEEEKPPERDDLDLINGGYFELEIGGDVRVSDDDPGRSNLQLRFHDRLPDNYRRFFVEPMQLNEGRILTGFLKCYTPGENGDRKCVRTFDFDVGPETVAAYHYREPEPEPEEPEVIEPEPEVKPETPPPPPPTQEPRRAQPPKQMNNASFARLTRPARPPKQLFREPRVLTGRSLMTLAREVEQGLTLAIHLDISDSAITGMGFDALANGLSLVDITYKILLLWKRRTRHLKDRQVDMLVEAMEEMGRKDLADLIRERHEQNLEITPDCLSASPAE